MCGDSIEIDGGKMQSNKFTSMSWSNVRCRIRKAIFLRTQIPQGDEGIETHLAGVDLLTAEGVVVGTHLDGWRCADGVGWR